MAPVAGPATPLPYNRGFRIATCADDLVIICRKGKAEEALNDFATSNAAACSQL